MKYIVPFFALVLLAFHSCKEEKHYTDFSKCETVTYEDNVKDLLNDRCNNVACHGADQQPVLTYYDAVKGAVTSGTLDLAINFPDSLHKKVDLSTEEIDIFNCWVNDSTPKN